MTVAPAGVGGNARDGAQQDDHYDYEDEFIDDSEFVEYYGGDRRKAVFRGFYVNRGHVEKVNPESCPDPFCGRVLDSFLGQVEKA